MPSKRKTRSSPAATGVVTVPADSDSGESLNKSRKKANLKTAEAVAAVAASPVVEKKTVEAVAASPVVEEKQSSNNDAAPMTVDDNGSDDEESNSRFVGDPIPDEEARRRWPQRYQEVTFLFSDASFFWY